MPLLFLVVDDEECAAAQRRHELARFGIRTYVARSFLRATEALASWAFDAVVLRAATLEPRCLALLRTLRSCGASPVLVLVDQCDEAHQIEAIASGAMDVMASSASSELIVAKLLRLLELGARSPRPEAEPPCNVGSLALDPHTGTASVDGIALDLTPYQFQLVSLLASKPGGVVSREEARDILMGTSDVRVVDVQVSRIRKKLKGVNADDVVLRTIRGRGYSLMASPPRRGAAGAHPALGWAD